MIRKILKRVFKTRTDPIADPLGNAEVIPQKKHRIAVSHISPAALKTIEALQKAGFEAYIVGGAVRDLLIEQRPKDFDVATNATPEQIKPLFRRAMIIGRRFRLVHVTFGDETIEVSTFRGHHTESSNHASVAESGRILRDNVYGSLPEDAARRDFTANALYYNPKTQEILDFHHGVADIKAGKLCMIGDPTTRYREDPVRMLRAVRLAAKLGITIDSKTAAPIPQLVNLLDEVPPSRLFDEMLKLFLSGHAVESIQALRAQHLHHGLLPLLDIVLEQPLGERFVMQALKNTDERVLGDKPVSPGFLFAALLWHEVLSAWQKQQDNGLKPLPALHIAMDDVIDVQTKKLAIHKRYSIMMKEIWVMQPRFEQRSGRRPFSLLENPRFRAAYDFLLLRAGAGEVADDLARWWTDFANADSGARQDMLLNEPAPKKRRRTRKKKSAGPNNAASSNATGSHTTTADHTGDSATSS